MHRKEPAVPKSTGRPDFAGDDERLYEQLADLLDTRERGGDVQTPAAPRPEQQLADGLQEYFDAAQVVDRFAAGLVANRQRRAAFPMPHWVDDHELLAEIGRGGAAMVYCARHARLNRLVAMKMLHGGSNVSLHDVERLRFEAEALAQLQHPGIVPIYDVGEHEGWPYFTMPLFEHGSLSGRLEHFLAEPRCAAGLIEQIAHAVQHAHERGILHRDLKPSNVLLDADGRPHVADFGLAKRLLGDHKLSRSNELIGTPAYMAPECVAGSSWAGPATIATDVYGLGAILFSLLTGRQPFQGETPIETLLAVGSTDVAAPASLNPRVERDLETICLKCLEKEPARRYATALDVAADLRCWLAGEPISARQPGRVELLRRWRRRHPVRAIAATAAVALLLIGAIGLSTGFVIVNRAYHTTEVHRLAAESHATRLNQRLYVSQMSLAHHHMERGELVELRAGIDAVRDRADPQPFEWRWLDQHARAMPKEETRYTGHTHFLYRGAFSPDERTVATCGADGTIRLWDARTGAEQRVLQNGAGLSPSGVPYDENCVAFSPDGTLLASVGEEGGVRLWTLLSGEKHLLSPTHSVEALCVEFSPDGTKLAAGWIDGHVTVWDVTSREVIAQLDHRVHSVQGVRFMPDGKELVTIDRGGRVSLWNVEQSRIGLQFDVPSNLLCLAVSPDGSQIATAGLDDHVTLWNAQTGQRIDGLRTTSGIRALAFSPDGLRLAATGNDGCVRIWSRTDGRLKVFFKAHPLTVWNLSFNPDGERLLTVSSDMTARIWRIPAAVATPDRSYAIGSPQHVCYSPDGRRLALITDEGEIRLCDANNPGDNVLIPQLAARHGLPIFLNDGRQLVFVDHEGGIQRWDCETGRLLPADPAAPRSSGTAAPMQLSVLEGNRLAAMTNLGDLFVDEGGHWEPIDTSGEASASRIVATLSGGRALVMSRTNPPRAELWTIVVDRPTFTHQISITGLTVCGAASKDGRWLALGQADGAIELRESTATTPGARLLGHHGTIHAVAFSDDSRTLASAGADGTARLWNVATAAELLVIARGLGPLRTVAFSPDGNSLAIGGDWHGNAATLTIIRTGQ